MIRTSLLISSLLILFLLSSCGKKEEQVYVPPTPEVRKDPEQERLEREEFERLKRLEQGDTSSVNDTSSALTSTDSANVKDTASSKSVKKEKKELVQKEKELNRRLDNPKTAVTDYIEYLQRAISGGGDFEQNIKKADEQWEKSNVGRFKRNYKDTKKIVVLEEPKVVSQKGDEAVVEVKISKRDLKDGKEVETNMTVKYILTADSKGKWKIRDNKVTTNK